MSKPPFQNAYSLWLMPDKTSYDRLERMIGRLAEKLGTEKFIGHMTLIGGLTAATQPEVVRLYETADRFIKIAAPAPLEVELIGVGMRDLYTQSVFLMAVPTKELMGLYGEAMRAFRVSGAPPFMPHASLAYGDLNYSQKMSAMQYVDWASGFPMTVTFDRVALFDCNGMPSDWHEVVNFDL